MDTDELVKQLELAAENGYGNDLVEVIREMKTRAETERRMVAYMKDWHLANQVKMYYETGGFTVDKGHARIGPTPDFWGALETAFSLGARTLDPR